MCRFFAATSSSTFGAAAAAAAALRGGFEPVFSQVIEKGLVEIGGGGGQMIVLHAGVETHGQLRMPPQHLFRADVGNQMAERLVLALGVGVHRQQLRQKRFDELIVGIAEVGAFLMMQSHQRAEDVYRKKGKKVICLDASMNLYKKVRPSVCPSKWLK